MKQNQGYRRAGISFSAGMLQRYKRRLIAQFDVLRESLTVSVTLSNQMGNHWKRMSVACSPETTKRFV